MNRQEAPRNDALATDAGKPAAPRVGPDHAARDADADARTTRQSARNGMLAMLVALAVLLLFNSAGLRRWVRDLPGNVVTDQLVILGSQWHDIMKRSGATTPMAIVQDAIAEFRDQSWRETLALPAVKPDASRVN